MLYLFYLSLCRRKYAPACLLVHALHTQLSGVKKPCRVELFLHQDHFNDDTCKIDFNSRCYGTNKSVFECDNHTSLSAEEVLNNEAPFLFVSFPSAKDPEWKNHPGRANKTYFLRMSVCLSACLFVSMCVCLSVCIVQSVCHYVLDFVNLLTYYLF